MIRLLFADLDGTLVGANGAVHPAIWRAAERARGAGIRLAICSGRPAFGLAREYAERLAPEGWHVFQNGASVVHLPSGQTRSASLPRVTITQLVKRARAAGRELELFSDFEYVVESSSERARTHAALLGVPFSPGTFDAFSAPVVRAQWLLAREAAGDVLTEPQAGIDVSPSTSPVMPDTLFVSLMPPGVDKGTGVRTVAEAYDIPLADTMFVGDSWNDAPALRLVGHPVAMSNAEPDTRALARHVVGDVDEGGLAEAMDLACSMHSAE